MKQIVVFGCLPIMVFLAAIASGADRAEKKTPNKLCKR